METLITVFIIVAAVAIVLQMIIMAGMYASMRKTGERMERLAERVEEHGVPALAAARTLLVENGPKSRPPWTMPWRPAPCCAARCSGSTPP